MVFSFKKQITALAVSALALAPVATGVTLLSAEAAFAKPGGSGGGGGGGRDRSSSGRSDRGDRDNGNRGAGRANDNNGSGNTRSSNHNWSSNNNSSSRTTQTQTQTTTTQEAPAPSNGNAYGQKTADEDRPGQGAIRSELKGMNAIHSFKDGAFPNAAPGSQVGRLAAYFETAGLTSVAFEDYDTALAAVAGFEETNPEFQENPEAEQDLTDALMAFNTNYSAEGESLEISSLEDVYTFTDMAYGTLDPDDEPIDTSGELQTLIDGLDPDAEDYDTELASLETLRDELANLELLDADLELQKEYAALNVTLTDDQCDYQNALDGEGGAFLDASNGRDIDEFSDASIAYLRDTLGLGETYSSPENPVDPADCSSI